MATVLGCLWCVLPWEGHSPAGSSQCCSVFYQNKNMGDSGGAKSWFPRSEAGFGPQCPALSPGLRCPSPDSTDLYSLSFALQHSELTTTVHPAGKGQLQTLLCQEPEAGMLQVSWEWNFRAHHALSWLLPCPLPDWRAKNCCCHSCCPARGSMPATTDCSVC